MLSVFFKNFIKFFTQKTMLTLVFVMILSIEGCPPSTGSSGSNESIASPKPSGPPPSAPQFNYLDGNYPSGTQIIISSPTAGASLYYTLDGNSPTSSSASYVPATQLLITTASTTIKAIAIKNGASSPVSTVTYTVPQGGPQAVATPIFSPPAGNILSGTNISLASHNGILTGVSIYYTLDGSTPDSGKTLYTGPFPLSSDTVVKAMATCLGYSNSGMAQVAYSIVPIASPAFSVTAQTYNTSRTQVISSTTPSATIYYTSTNDGTEPPDPTTSSAIYTTDIDILEGQSKRFKAIAVVGGLSSAIADSGVINVVAMTNSFVGTRGFSPGPCLGGKLAVDQAGMLYALQLITDTNSLVFSQYDGTQWNQLNSPGSSQIHVPANSNYTLKINQTTIDLPIVAYQDYTTRRLVVKKYNGTTWFQVGSLLPITGDFALAIHPQTNQPYVAYNPNSTSAGTITVQGFDGTRWNTVGTSSSTGQRISLAFNPITNQPAIAYKNEANNLVLQTYDGTGWTSLTNSTDTLDDSSPVLYYNLSGIPYICFKNASNNQLTMTFYNNSAWSYPGNLPTFSGTTISYFTMAMDNNGRPMVCFADAANNEVPRAMHLNANDLWQNMTLVDNYEQGVHWLGSAVSPSNIFYIAFEDFTNNQAMSVIAFIQ